MLKDRIKEEYDKKYFKREDDNHLLKYFRPSDFNDLSHKPISFKSNLGQKLNGYIFYNDNLKNYKNMIVFLHGAGGGYLSYMKEIYTLVKGGYLVFTYDYTATFSSEGEKLIGFSQPLIDLKYALEYIKCDPFFSKLDIYLMGHSWGAFCALNALNYKEPIIKKVVALAPITSVREVFNSNIKGLKKYLITPILMKYEYEKFGDVAYFNAFDAMDSDVDILVVTSLDDPLVNAKQNTLKLKKYNKKDNHHFLLVNNRLHNPNYTKDAANYLNFKLKEFNKLVKTKKLNTFEEMKKYFESTDWNRATAQDMDVFNQIFKFLGGK